MKKQLIPGAKAVCLDGEAGQVSKIVTDPQTQRPTYLVVKRGRLLPREVVVPVSLVAEVTPETVELDTTTEALAGFPDYEVTVRKGEYREPISIGYPRPIAVHTPPSNQSYVVLRQRSVPEQSVAVEKGMAVRDCDDRQVGEAEGIIVDAEERQGSHVILRRPHPLADDLRVIPADLVEDVQGSEIHLRITAEQVDGLGVYQPATE